MRRLKPVLVDHQPDLVLVYGDINSTLAAALVCAKRGIRLGHVEAGLRSFDRSMPEEINRILTDRLADFLFTPSEDGDINLRAAGISPERIHRVGNVMIDTLVHMLPAALQTLPPEIPDRFILLTLHRPSNVDQTGWLSNLMVMLAAISREIPILFPVHPRTRRQLALQPDLDLNATDIRLLDPLPYLEFLGLQSRATLVITDSGGIQEETTYLGTPCITVRECTERPVTVTMGTNLLAGQNLAKLRQEVSNVLAGKAKHGTVPPLWDGHAAERIANVLCGRLEDGCALAERDLAPESARLETV
jgi:UDP-N-acetylglucosamine 2-epimerase (non-hydrolysing)